ncbi:hypothetical protein [Candidatus Macondimonas diazotrophica]|uniref:Uncharacterized protein n=1 Tax=Candidatus Macondimonas diazotrophica TaxID=2305248 RepID=A0A4Z0F9I5_9GAMM|nr:hypothetical protein [Candidatus Macondimonas diazotrophica]NCU01476.1 hypothetical protein [Candidatus Macondimonas diazotrophica]TFZ83075.1 hypothetical protein E4680_05430 [Candidatus Macondimonas diazotrophica]HBG31456.1 hypothetical protein [Gammaproteobacteria bacterium]HBG50302.1 hypothetical protein [Gammaproteobacteria bacterium]
MSLRTFRWWVAVASLSCMPAWVGACDLPEGIAPGPAVDAQILDGFYLGGDICLYDPISVSAERVPRFRGSRTAPDAPTLYYVNGANGSPVITAVNVAVLAEISQIAILGIFYAGNGAGVAIDAFPAVSSGPAVATLEQVIADHLTRQEPVHIRGGSAGTVVISEAIHGTRNRLAREARLRGDWAAPLDLLRVETHGSVARDFPDGPRYIHYDAKPDPVPKVGVAGPVAHPGARALIARFGPDQSWVTRGQAVVSLAQSVRTLEVGSSAMADDAALLSVLNAQGLGVDEPFQTQNFIAGMGLAALTPVRGRVGAVPDALKGALAFLSNAFLAVHGAQTYDPYRRPFDVLYATGLTESRRVRHIDLQTPPPVMEGL